MREYTVPANPVEGSLELPGGGYLVNAPVGKIEVPPNRLRELRDYAGLAASMDEIGLRQPITITEAGNLVSGRHRLEAARSLGWTEIPAFVVEDDDLRNRLTEIDENLRRLDLTVYEQSKHAAERERVLEALGQRMKSGTRTDLEPPATVAGGKTTAQLASETGLSERSWRNRTKIGNGLGEKTRAVLDQADPTEEKHRNFLNSTTQLDHLANISRHRGDEVAAEIAERVLTQDGSSTFKVYEGFKDEATGDKPPSVHFSSETPEWYTPQKIIERVRVALGEIDTDPCADPNKSVPARFHYTKEDDGLSQEWRGRVYMNPPYGQGIGAWVRKLTREYASGNTDAAIALVPARTDTEWFAHLRDFPRCFIRGRLKFSGHENSAPFPSAAFYLGDPEGEAAFVAAFKDLGDVFRRVES